MSIICTNLFDPLLQLMRGACPPFAQLCLSLQGHKEARNNSTPVPPAKQSANKDNFKQCQAQVYDSLIGTKGIVSAAKATRQNGSGLLVHRLGTNSDSSVYCRGKVPWDAKADGCLTGDHSCLEMRALGFNWKCFHWHSPRLGGVGWVRGHHGV